MTRAGGQAEPPREKVPADSAEHGRENCKHRDVGGIDQSGSDRFGDGLAGERTK